MALPQHAEHPEQIQPIDLRKVERLNPRADRVRLSALDLARGIAIFLMVMSHSIKGLLTFEQMPPFGIMPIHTITKFSSSLFFLVFGFSLSLFFLPYTHTDEWKSKRNHLLWRGVQIMIAYKILTVVQMYSTYSSEFIIDTLLFKRFPDFVEVLGFYGFCLMWIPFLLPLWRGMPIFSKLSLCFGMLLAGFVLNLVWDFGGYSAIKAILVEETGYFTFGQFQRGAVVIFGIILGDFFTYFRGHVYREKYIALLTLLIGAGLMAHFYTLAEGDLYNTLYNIGKNQGKHPPTMVFMSFSLGGALCILGVTFLFGRWLPKLLRPITVMGESPLFSFYFHIIVIFIFFRDIYGLHHKTTYEVSWWLTGALLLMTSASAAASVRIQKEWKISKAKKAAAKAAAASLAGVISICLFSLQVFAEDSVTQRWNQKLQTKMMAIQKSFDGEAGVFVKDLDSGVVYSTNSDTYWYLASNIKIFVLIEILRKIDKGDIHYRDAIQIQKGQYRDGSGQTNWIEAGQSVSLHFLIEQMMIESDNAATDIMIDMVGVDALNKGAQEFIPGAVSQITSLLEVRYSAFSEFHPKARDLSNMDFITLKKVKDDHAKIKKFLELVGIEKKELRANSMTEAFERYYDRGLNSATLTGYASLLEKIAKGQVLSPERSQEMLDLMRRCFTGKDRIIAGLSKDVRFAHKTGTQHRRACDMGIITPNDKKKSKRVVVAACTQKFKSNAASDEVFKKIGEAVMDSGVMDER
ncbi:MAG: serine hydrolase [Bdellovibrionia bacterium]